MKKLDVDALMIRAKLRAQRLFSEFVNDQRGDTNFVAIIVIIGIILVVAVIFRDRLSAAVSNVFNNVDSWTSSNSGT